MSNSTSTSANKEDSKRVAGDSGNWHKQPPYGLAEPDQEFKADWEASCFCGGVKYEARGDPLDVKFCHCKGCQRLHGAPAQWAAIFHKKDIHITTPVSNIGFYNSEHDKPDRELPCKLHCKNCKSPIFDEGRNMVMLFPTLIKFPRKASGVKDPEADQTYVPDVWKAKCHIFYKYRVMDVLDGTPKWSGHKDASDPCEERIRRMSAVDGKEAHQSGDKESSEKTEPEKGKDIS
ncbi:hypothetical protein YB2330_004656 [Saitoella coloradoensis]